MATGCWGEYNSKKPKTMCKGCRGKEGCEQERLRREGFIQFINNTVPPIKIEDRPKQFRPYQL